MDRAAQNHWTLMFIDDTTKEKTGEQSRELRSIKIPIVKA
jgi:hypothetical protein